VENASRFVELAGACNFRDLGGLPTTGGGALRRGRLFRSDALHGLERVDVERLHELGIATIVDLRSEHEVAATGRGLLANEPIRWFHAPLSNVGAPDYQPSEALASGELGRHYLDTLDERTATLARAFTHLATREHLPAVFHCTVGKDRTGVLAALVLGCVGVPEPVIVDDYALTDERMALLMSRLRGTAFTPEAVRALGPSPIRAEARSMREFLAGLDARYGGPRGWARAAGIDDTVVAELRVLLVEEEDVDGGA
jgi:protein-tyrosine phosphatase